MKTKTVHLIIIFFVISIFTKDLLYSVAWASDYIQFEESSLSELTLWSRTYGGINEDTLYDMTVDDNGNIYLTGSAYTENDKDVVTIKYAPNGTTEWVQTYDGPGHELLGSDDGGYAIVVDDLGFVYITGWSPSSTETDIITLRYTPEGELDWARRFDSGQQEPAPRGESGFSLAVDDQAVYVAGMKTSPEGVGQIVTLKYSLDGTFAWDRTVPGLDVVGIVADGAGSCIAVGEVYDPISNYDLVIVKYASDGSTSFYETYNSQGSNRDHAAEIILDTDSNLYITGNAEYLVGSTSQNAILTVMFNASGDYQWHDLYPGQSITGFGQDIIISLDGRIWIGGSVSLPESGWNYALLGYTSEGKLEKEIYYQRGLGAYFLDSIAIDSSGNFYLAGRAGIVKLDPFGSDLWAYQPDETMDRTLIAISNDRAPVIAGSSGGDYLTVKYPSKPATTFSFTDLIVSEASSEAVLKFQIPSSVPYDVSLSVKTVDGSAKAGVDYMGITERFTITNNNTYWQISIPIIDNGIENQDSRSFRVKVSGPLNAAISDWSASVTIIEDDLDLHRWNTTYNGVDLLVSTFRATKVDSSGNSYIAVDDKLISYSPDGIYRWELPLSISARNLSITPDDQVVLVGDSYQGNLVVQKINSDGSVVWIRDYDHAIGTIERGFEVFANNYGEIIASGQVLQGYTQSGIELSNILTVKYDAGGQLLWANVSADVPGWSGFPIGIGVDQNGNTFISAYYYVPTTSLAIAGLIKYSPTGVPTRSTLYSHRGFDNPEDYLNDSITDRLGNTYLALDSGQRGVIAKFNSELKFEWDYEFPGGNTGYSTIRALTVDQNLDILGCGFMNGGLAFKFNTAGQMMWWLDDANTTYNDAIIDSQGYLAIAGHSYVGDQNFETLRISPDGDIFWRQQYSFDYQAYTEDISKRINLDERGNLYIIGITDNNFLSLVSYTPLPDLAYLNISSGHAFESSTNAIVKIPISLSIPLSQDLEIAYKTVDGSAIAGLDYAPTSGIVTIPAGDLSAIISVPVQYDELDEFGEYFFLNFEVLSGTAIVRGSQGKGVIWDGDVIQNYLPLLIR